MENDARAEQIQRDKVRCQELLDRASMQNPHSIMIAAMDNSGRIMVAKIQHDPGVEALLLKALELATNESLYQFMNKVTQGKIQDPPETPPSNSDPAH